MKWFANFKNSLTKTAHGISSGFMNALKRKLIDAETIEELQDALIAADISLPIAQELLKGINHLKIHEADDLEQIVRIYLSHKITEMLSPYARDFGEHNIGKQTILLCGVNGNGKTTTAGKLAQHFRKKNQKVVLAACDTFRASAVEQLIALGERVSCKVITGDNKQDPCSVAYKAGVAFQDLNADILLIDTAGRLHSNNNLMLELDKTSRVLKKIDTSWPNEVLIVLDGGTGQNAIQQLESFKKILPITGMIITKLDGSSKGGIILTLTQMYKVPVYAICIGEDMNDICELNPRLFAESIMGLATNNQ